MSDGEDKYSFWEFTFQAVTSSHQLAVAEGQDDNCPLKSKPVGPVDGTQHRLSAADLPPLLKTAHGFKHDLRIHLRRGRIPVDARRRKVKRVAWRERAANGPQ